MMIKDAECEHEMVQWLHIWRDIGWFPNLMRDDNAEWEE
jgi:hypothetical protein